MGGVLRGPIPVPPLHHPFCDVDPLILGVVVRLMQVRGFALRARGCHSAGMAAEAALFAWIHAGVLASILLWMMVWYGCSLAARLECEQSPHWSSTVDLRCDADVVVFAPLRHFVLVPACSLPSSSETVWRGYCLAACLRCERLAHSNSSTALRLVFEVVEFGPPPRFHPHPACSLLSSP